MEGKRVKSTASRKSKSRKRKEKCAKRKKERLRFLERRTQTPILPVEKRKNTQRAEKALGR